MNLSSQPAPQTRTFQSWRSIFLATILLVTVAITISTFYFTTVQAESHGAITGLTLTSNAPGTLTASWDAASPTPTDYRVDWAKSDEDYQSWRTLAQARGDGPSTTQGQVEKRPCPCVVPDEPSGRLVPTNTKLKEQYQ